MTDRKYTGIQKITVNSIDEENIMDVDVWAINDEGGEDLVEIQFAPATVEGVGAKQWGKAFRIKIVHDGWTDVWDTYLDLTDEGVFMPNFSVTFDILTNGVVGTEVWTFQANKCYIENRDDVKTEIEQRRTPGAVYVLCIGTVAVTHP